MFEQFVLRFNVNFLSFTSTDAPPFQHLILEFHIRNYEEYCRISTTFRSLSKCHCPQLTSYFLIFRKGRLAVTQRGENWWWRITRIRDDEDYAIKKDTARACVKVGAKSGTCFSCSWGETAVSIPASNPLAAGKLGTDSSSLDRRCPSRISIYITVVPCNEVEMEYPW